MLTNYFPTDSERYIKELYTELNFFSPRDIDIDTIATYFDIDIVYYEGRPKTKWFPDGSKIILLNKFTPTYENRLRFFHELCHILKHVGNQDKLPKLFRDLQEEQAFSFQRYAAMPYHFFEPYLKLNCRNTCISAISEDFNVSLDDAKKRLEQVERRIYQGMWDKKINATRRIHLSKKEGYSEETLRIMAQLYRQIQKKMEA